MLHLIRIGTSIYSKLIDNWLVLGSFKCITFALLISWFLCVLYPQYVRGQDLADSKQSGKRLNKSKYIQVMNFPVLTPVGTDFESDRVYNPSAIIDFDGILSEVFSK